MGPGFTSHRGCRGHNAVGHRSAAVFTVDEQLADLLGNGDVVHDDG